MNNLFLNRSQLLLKLLVQGLRVDLAYSIVVILVITALFSTPLILGSIKNRVYVAVEKQIVNVNNAREITIQQAETSARLDSDFLASLRSKYSDFHIFGNLKPVVMVKGPVGSDISTLKTAVHNDPRTESLQIKPEIPSNFGLFDVIVSDQLGEILYGDEWYTLWNTKTSQFTGKPLTLIINDIPIKGEFNIVARQTTPGFGLDIYASEQLGIALKKYSIGLGSEKLGLPMVPDQIQYALPRFETMHCILELPNNQCNAEQQTKIIERLKAEKFQVEPSDKSVVDINRFQITLTKFDQFKGRVQLTRGHCEKRLYHHLQVCPSAIVTPQISLSANLVATDDTKKAVQLSGITSASYDLLPGIQEMMNQQGGKKLNFWDDGISENGIEMVAPYRDSISLGTVNLHVAGTSIPAFVTAYYQCSEKGDCPFYTTPLAVFRLQNMIDGAAIFKHGNPPVFYPTKQQQRIDYDEILFYANKVEEVETWSDKLEKELPGYKVQYNIAAINKLKRQDQMLSGVFQLTLILSIIFIVLAVGALAKINVDKRRRQMAQLFILGYSKSFVSLLLVCEYILLTALASIAAIGVGTVIFSATRHLFQSHLGTTIVNAMRLDIGAFGNVFFIVVLLTTLVAGLAAYLASKSDPVELLD